ncbi:MAG: rhomboid family intramembrane serine protease [Coraliomargarita sp.]
MELDENTSLPPESEIPLGLRAVGWFLDMEEAHEAGLAVLAMGQAYWMFPFEDGYALCIDLRVAGAVEQELVEWRALRAKQRKQVQVLWPGRPVVLSPFVWFCVLLCGIFSAQQAYTLVDLGSSDALAIFEKQQWWRVVTALTLHGDIVHLVSNLVAGVGFVLLVARVFGMHLGWLMVFLSGALGNLLTAWLHYPQSHVSIGASTAVFGALGILTGASVWLALFDPRRSLSLPQWLLPMLGGLTLLGLLGMGEGPIDILAHVCGFGFGLFFGLAGACLKWPEEDGKSLLLQWSGWLVPLGVALCWACALWA